MAIIFTIRGRSNEFFRKKTFAVIGNKLNLNNPDDLKQFLDNFLMELGAVEAALIRDGSDIRLYERDIELKHEEDEVVNQLIKKQNEIYYNQDSNRNSSH